MKHILLFLLLLSFQFAYSQKKLISITVSSTITYPGMEDGTTVKRYVFSIESLRKDEIKEIWFQDDHIYSDEKICLKKGTNTLIIEYRLNQYEGTVFTKVTLNSIDITEICFFEPMDQQIPFGIFTFRKGPRTELNEFKSQKVLAMP